MTDLINLNNFLNNAIGFENFFDRFHRLPNINAGFPHYNIKKAGQDEFGVILLDEEPEWVWMRSDESGNNIVLRLNQENGYFINVTQGDTEIIDYELGDGDNYIDIYQNQ